MQLEGRGHLCTLLRVKLGLSKGLLTWLSVCSCFICLQSATSRKEVNLACMSVCKTADPGAYLPGLHEFLLLPDRYIAVAVYAWRRSREVCSLLQTCLQPKNVIVQQLWIQA